jgi:hypothetical protein
VAMYCSYVGREAIESEVNDLINALFILDQHVGQPLYLQIKSSDSRLGESCSQESTQGSPAEGRVKPPLGTLSPNCKRDLCKYLKCVVKDVFYCAGRYAKKDYYFLEIWKASHVRVIDIQLLSIPQ